MFRICYITEQNMLYVMLSYITCVMLCYITYVILYDICSEHVIEHVSCYVI